MSGRPLLQGAAAALVDGHDQRPHVFRSRRGSDWIIQSEGAPVLVCGAGARFGSGAATQCGLGAGLGILQGDGLQRSAHISDCCGGHRQCGHAQAHQHDGQIRISRSLSADAHWLAGGSTGIAELLHQAQHGRVPGVLVAGNRAEHAVGNGDELELVVEGDEADRVADELAALLESDLDA